MCAFIINKITNYLVFLSIAAITLITGSFVIETQQTKTQTLGQTQTQAQTETQPKIQTKATEDVIADKLVTKLLIQNDGLDAAVINHNNVKEQPSRVISISNFPVTQGYLSSSFGMRKDPFDGRRRMHYGIDIAARSGTEVNPMGSGKVIFTGHKAGYGKTVEIQHGHSVITRYSHLKEILVEADQQVSQEDIIGFVGNTGRSTGPHLHLEVVLGDDKVDPRTFLAGQIASNSKSKSKPKFDTFKQASLARVSYQDYLQSFDGVYGLKAPDH